MNRSPMPRLTLVALLLILAAPDVALAERLPSFNLDGCVGQARLILRGQLDATGAVQVTEVLASRADKPKAISLAGGGETYGNLGKVMKADGRAIEVVAFLAEETGGAWRSVWGEAGVVGLDAAGVYTLGGGEEVFKPSMTFVKHPGYTRDGFLKAVASAIEVKAQRDALTALPRSPERAGKLVDFAVAHGQPEARFHLYHIARAMAPIDPAEQKVVLQRMSDAAKGEHQALLLELAGAIPLDKTAFSDIAPLIDKDKPAVVRRAALSALMRIDAYAGSERIAGLLTLREPQLLEALQALGAVSYPSSDAKLSGKVVDVLAALARDFRNTKVEPANNDMVNVGYGIVHQLEHYAHPRLIGELYAMAFESEWSCREQALCNLQSVAGLKWNREQKAEWERWWKAAQPVLVAKYDLTTPAGIAQWAKVYSGADAGVQRLLLRLWIFEPSIDEAALLKAATAKDNPAGPISAAMELWRVGRLSPGSRGTMFDAFFEVEMVEDPQPNDPKQREVFLHGTPRVPFPRGTEIQYRYGIALDKEPILAGRFENCVVLEGTQTVSLGSLGTHAGGAPIAKALLEIRQLDGDRQVIWSSTRAFGPVLLQVAP